MSKLGALILEYELTKDFSKALYNLNISVEEAKELLSSSSVAIAKICEISETFVLENIECFVNGNGKAFDKFWNGKEAKS